LHSLFLLYDQVLLLCWWYCWE